MSEAKHTKGPWRILFDYDNEQISIGGPWDGRPAPTTDIRHVADVGNVDADEDVANAHLIAAAPELLEALEFVMESEMSDWKAQEEFGGYVLDGDVRDKAKAAIAKAKGESTP